MRFNLSFLNWNNWSRIPPYFDTDAYSLRSTHLYALPVIISATYNQAQALWDTYGKLTYSKSISFGEKTVLLWNNEYGAPFKFIEAKKTLLMEN